MLILILLISSGSIFSSCNKEDEITTAELIAAELQLIIKENEVQRVICFEPDQKWENTWIIGDYGKNYKFEGQFVFIEGEGYNLNQFLRYQIRDRENIRFLILWFG